jgi:hypothetical protein
MSGFWGNVIANLIGTFAGAGLALLSSWAITRRVARSNEAKLLQGTIDRLGRSRVFTHMDIEHSGAISPEEEEDLRRSTESVLASRDYISRVITDLGIANPAVPILEEMHVACALYVRSIEEYPTEYVRALVDLRGVLLELERDLCRINTHLRLREPGEIAFRASDQPDSAQGFT